MIMEQKRVSYASEDVDNFPVGMRVLAVDDDLACLKLLDALLRKCQYHVTTTNRAETALNMLREDKTKFDLVISDVQMPDMDGFKLLELVGLEMDLPVLMLSAHSDTKFVMKGITHGACDYLVKPVRIEELKNIWQHVIRRKKIESKYQNTSSNHRHANLGDRYDFQRHATCNSDHNEKHGRKRKDRDEDEHEEDEENENENDDPSSQKKPRVVWSGDLHRKFVAAVNQLGIDKAFPKRILDLMNEEGLTRENVASHLQKFRLYLKRISLAASQQANIAAAALGIKDSSYLSMNSLNDFSEYNTMSSLSSYPHSGMIGRLNTPGFTLCNRGNLSNCPPNTCNSNSSMGKIQPVQNRSIFLGVPTSFELGDFHHADSMVGFSLTSETKPRVTTTTTTTNNPLLLQGNTQQKTPAREFANQPILKNISLNKELFERGVSGKLNGSLQRLPPNCPSHSMALSRDISSNGSRLTNVAMNFTLASEISPSFDDSSGEMQCHDGLLGNVVRNVNQYRQNSFVGQKIRSNEDYPLEQVKLSGGFVQNECDSLEDLMEVMRREESEAILMDREFGINAHSLV